MSDSDTKMRVVTSLPSLKGKVKLDIAGPADAIYWYIRFNIPLDESTVNEQTMEVTDTDGYIMRTDITYQTQQNRICISPLDSYEEGRYYLLNITKQVCSARGQPLKSKIHILFKLYKAQVSEFKVMRKDAKVPKPKPRPDNYDQLQATRAPNKLDMEYDDKVARDRMLSMPFKVNMWLGLLGLVLVLVGFAMQNMIFVAVSAGVCLLGAAHIFRQLRDRDISSNIYYNRGVRHYNNARFAAAQTAFEKSLQQHPEHELSKYGLYKVQRYNNPQKEQTS